MSGVVQQAVAISGRVRVRWTGRALQDWAYAERGRFAPWLPVFMGAGVLVYFGLGREPAWWVGLAATLLAAAACAIGWGRFPTRAAALAGLAAALGFLSGQAATWRAKPVVDLPRTAATMTATVRGVDVLPNGRRLVLEGARIGDGQPLERLVRVRLKRGDETPVVAGDLVRVRAVMRPPSAPSYPGGWDQQRDAFFAGLGAGGTGLDKVTVLEHRDPAGAAGWMQAVRDGVGRRVMAGIAGPPGAIAATFLTGSTASIPEADRAAFRDSGLAHLLAVAGLHIGIVMGLVFGATRIGLACWERAALRWSTKAIAAWAALAAGAGYMVLAGAHVPVIRSFAMACLVTLGVAAGRRAVSLRGLALAAAALMLMAPNEVNGVSFQMSFAAVLSLISGYEALRPALARLQERRWLAHLAALLLTSLLAGTASAMYGAYHFGHIQLYFVLANVVAVPLTATVVMPAGLLALTLMPLGLEQVALWPMGWGIEAILWIGRAVSALPAATLAVPPIPTLGLGVFSLGLAWLGLWRTRWRLLGLAPMLAGLLSPLAAPPPDLLVSADARLIAWRADGAYWLQEGSGGSRYTREEWESHLGTGPFRIMSEGQPGACTATQCRRGPLLLLRDAIKTADCTGAGLLVSAEPARGVCPGAGLLDRFTVWRDGAQSVWIEGERATVRSDRAERGDRPWVPPPPSPRRNRPALPMAEAE